MKCPQCGDKLYGAGKGSIGCVRCMLIWRSEEVTPEPSLLCDCGAKGWQARVGYRASGEPYQGCENCVDDDSDPIY